MRRPAGSLIPARALPAAGAVPAAAQEGAAAGAPAPGAVSGPAPGCRRRVRLLGARALPHASAVSRRGAKLVFVVCRGSLAAGRLEAVHYGTSAGMRHTVCTAAGNIDSGAVFHGFRTDEEAGEPLRAGALVQRH